MSAVNTPLVIEQGTTWTWGWRVTVDGAPPVGSWTARSQVRSRGIGAVLHTFTATIVDDLVTLSVAPSVSSAWTWAQGVYDVEIESAAGVVLRVAEGTVRVSREVTR